MVLSNLPQYWGRNFRFKEALWTKIKFQSRVHAMLAEGKESFQLAKSSYFLALIILLLNHSWVLPLRGCSHRSKRERLASKLALIHSDRILGPKDEWCKANLLPDHQWQVNMILVLHDLKSANIAVCALWTGYSALVGGGAVGVVACVNGWWAR